MRRALRPSRPGPRFPPTSLPVRFQESTPPAPARFRVRAPRPALPSSPTRRVSAAVSFAMPNGADELDIASSSSLQNQAPRPGEVAVAPRVSLPSEEPAGTLPGEHTTGVGALPGSAEEAGVAVLPEERGET